MGVLTGRTLDDRPAGVHDGVARVDVAARMPNLEPMHDAPRIRKAGATCTRRAALGRLAALLAAGLWPGALRAEAEGAKAEAFVFVAANDFHHFEPACDAWFAALFQQIGAHAGLELCLGLGDLAHRGERASFEAIKRLSAGAGVPFYPLAGNHDCDVTKDTSLFAEVFPRRLNYVFTHRGWQFVAVDSTAGTAYKDTRVTEASFAWLDGELAKLDRRAPTILLTHFPLTTVAKYSVANAEDLLARFTDFNLRLALTGHYHAQTRGERNGVELVTNVCCSRVAGNHDGSTAKGYWLCRAGADGALRREFVAFTGPAEAAPIKAAVPA